MTGYPPQGRLVLRVMTRQGAPTLPTLLFTLLALMLAAQASPRRACADDWTDDRIAFRGEVKSEDWRKRRDAYLLLTNHDSAEAVDEALNALDDESNAAVVLGALDALGMMVTLEARGRLFDVARKGKGVEKLLAIRVLSKLEGDDVDAVLLEVAQAKDAPAIAAAVGALGAREALPAGAAGVFKKLLAHKDWQVQSAVGRAILAHPDPTAVPQLAAAFAKAKGRERLDLLGALEKTTGHAYGNDPKAWTALAKGTPPAEIQPQPTLVPTAFGIPIYGRRVVIVLDNSLRMGDPHPFDTERLRELCDPSDGDAIPWFRMSLIAHFAHAHVKHLIQGLPKGTRFELIPFNEFVRPTFGELASVGAASRKLALETLAALKTDDGIATFEALNAALDIEGAKEAKAWKSGPDEILFITVNQPTKGDVTEGDLVASAIAMKASRRMVPIHAVGIHFHPYEMCQRLAESTGGTYVNLVK